MGSRLIVGAPHEADNLLETSLREAFELLESQLSPPFSLKCRNELEYFDINKAIIYGILCEPQMGNVHIKHLHGIVTDGYAFFTNTLVRIVDELYEKLVDSVRVQLIWITLEMIDVSAIGFQGLLVALLRQIVGGDFSDKNLWLCSELGVQSSFDVLVRRGVVQSLDVLISSDKLFPFLKERIVKLLSERKVTSLENLQAGSFRGSTSLPDHPAAVRMESGTLQHDMSASASQNDVELGPPTNVTSCSPLAENDDIHQQSLESLVQNLGKHIRSSKQMGMQALDKILHLYVNLSSKAETTNFSISPNQLSSIIAKEFQYSGNQLFEQNWDQDLQSASAIIIRHFMFSQHETLLGMLLCWNRDGLTVGPCFLAYAINLAHEAHVLGYVTHPNTVAHPDTLRDSNKTTDSGMSLLKYHCEQYCCFVNKGKDLSQAIISTSSINVKLVTTLIEGAFAAYRGFNMHRGRELAPNSDNYLPKILYCDLMSYAKQDNRILKFSLYGISSNLRDLFLCEENIMKSIVSQLDYSDLLDIQFDLGSKKLSIFGDSIEAISHLIRSSFQWECIEQHNFWGLLRSELAVSEVPKEKVLLEFFCTDGLDPKISSIAVGGLLALCSSLAPTPDLVGAVLLLPNKIFTNFATTVLSAWAVSNTSMLFTSLAEFMDKINAGDSMIPDLSEIMINNSAFIWLLNFLDAKRNEKQQL
ncbi:hypothetical protein DCAR_0934801 [Daucus carota subsp. sativus]|uniref:Uncharacterized protein n=1 Tax=Daucus carota subsp. sativus TaxID=79200 RepID=A0A175YB50_DAUCS|nr:hypothetical protein DCAR_0934801 [Daucus carota subsp. sativus]